MTHYITYFEMAAFAASLLAWSNIKRNNYLRLFPLLLLIIVSVEGYERFIEKRDNVNNAWLYNITVPVQYLIYLAILYYAINNKPFKKIIIAVSVLFIIVTIFTQIFFVQKGTFNTWSYSTGSIILIVLILIKFYEMLQKPAAMDFMYDPFFYMLFAFLLFKVGTLTYFVAANWVGFQQDDQSKVIIFQNVMSILNYILYSVYTTAFVWIKMKGSY